MVFTTLCADTRFPGSLRSRRVQLRVTQVSKVIEYATLVVDPPWQVSAGRSIGRYEVIDGKQPFGVTDNAARKLAYPSMDLAAIKALQVPAANDAHLYLWTINKYLPAAFDVMAAWGFDYSTTLVWAKKPMGGGLGGCYGLATEFCLFGRKGRLSALARTGRNWFDWKRPYKNGYPHHSAKPPEFYTMVEAMSPGPRIDMFARSERDNWDVWGNEV
jgi:N6-adenosine-specific RNA methylase IME4